MPTAGIFAGGFGKRLMPLTSDVPKVMIEVFPGIPLLGHTLDLLARGGINRTFLMVGHLWKNIEDHFGRNYKGMTLDYLVEEEPKGTLWALRNLYKDREMNGLLLMNGDVVSGIDIRDFIENAKRSETLMTLVHTDMVSPYGILEIRDGFVRRFDEKPVLDLQINAGIYHLKEGVGKYLEREYRGYNVETTLFKDLASDGQITGYKLNGFHCSLDSLKDLERIRDHFRDRQYVR